MYGITIAPEYEQQETCPPGAELLDVDVIADFPGWFTVAVWRYTTGTRYDIVCSEHLAVSDMFDIARDNVPAFAIRLGSHPSDTFGGLCEREATLSFWEMS